MARILIAAAHKSSGKTTASLGLAAAMSAAGTCVQPFKKGPDYIDPMWLGRAAGRDCFNLDFNTMAPDEIRALFARRAVAAGNGINLVEANKGLYDGVDLAGSDSNAALAKLLALPVVLVIDTEGMTRGIAPLVLGYQMFDRDVDLRGIILNRTGGARHEGKLRAALEHYTDVPVLGAVRRNAALDIAERHLGLTTPGEVGRLDDKIATIAAAVRASVDIDRVMNIAAAAPPLASIAAPAAAASTASDRDRAHAVPGRPLRIAVARDAAFGFYYPDDLQALEAGGAALRFFDCLHDEALPAADGLFIGGGFPETQMQALAANAALRGEIKRAIEAGLPAYAECGGLMYLARSLTWRDERCEMCGVIPGDAVMHKTPRGRGHVTLRERRAMPWPAAARAGDRSGLIHAHEFHYASLENIGAGVVFAYDVARGSGIDGRHDGIVMHNLVAGFTHQRHTAANPWTTRFLSFVRDHARIALASAKD